MTPETLNAVAARLLKARHECTALASLGPDESPATIEEGYALQDALDSGWGEPIAGWKIGATATAVQQKFAISEPFAGPAYKPSCHRSPAALPAAHFQHHLIESEFAFRFFRPVRPADAISTRAEILDCVDALVPTIEIVSPRLAELPFGRGPLAIADWAVNGALVTGTPVLDGWQALDLKSHEVRLLIDGGEAARGTGALVLGDPVSALEWAVPPPPRRGRTTAAGQTISPGTPPGSVQLPIGSTATADFGSLGQVSLTFTAS